MSYLVDIEQEVIDGDYAHIDRLLDSLYYKGYLDDLDRSRTAEQLIDDYFSRVGTEPVRLLVDDEPGVETVMMMTDMRSERRRAEGAREISLAHMLNQLR